MKPFFATFIFLLATMPFTILLAHSASAADELPPLGWVYPPPQPLRVHIVRGLWSREYRLEEAVALSHAGAVTESWHTQGLSFGYVGGWDPLVTGSVPEFPETAEDLLANHVLIICNVNALAFMPAQQKRIADFVSNGGAVLFLGGRFAFGSQWNKTPLAELAPATFVEQGFDLKSSDKGLSLGVGPGQTFEQFSNIGPEKAPRVFWYHEVKPKAGTQVILVADSRPLLITGSYGKGRVALFAGSVMGDPPAGALAFWEWEHWPEVLAQTLNWLAAARGQLNTSLDAPVREQLQKALAPIANVTDENEAQAALKAAEPLLSRVAKICHDSQTAELIVNAIAGGQADPTPAIAEALGRFAGGLLAERAAAASTKLIASGKPGKTALGLRLLGAAKTANAAPILLRFLSTGDVETPDDPATTDGKLPAIIMAKPGEKETLAMLIRLAALDGLNSLGDPTTLPAIRRAIEDNQKKGRFDKITGDEGTESYRILNGTRLYQTALVAALNCGDATAAGPLADALLGNVYVASRSRSGWNDPMKPNKTTEGSLPHILAWQAEIHDMLRHLPDARIELLAEPLAAIADIRIVPSACAAFAGRALSPKAAAALCTSSVKAVALIGP